MGIRFTGHYIPGGRLRLKNPYLAPLFQILPSISYTVLQPNQVFTAQQGTWTGTNVVVTRSWKLNGVEIGTGTTVTPTGPRPFFRAQVAQTQRLHRLGRSASLVVDVRSSSTPTSSLFPIQVPRPTARFRSTVSRTHSPQPRWAKTHEPGARPGSSALRRSLSVK